MVYTLFTSLAQSSLPTFSHSPYFNSSKTFLKRTHTLFRTTRPPPHVCFFSGRGKPKPDLQPKENEGGLQISKRWDVPWEWQTVSLTSLACGLSFVLTGLVEAAVVPYLGLSIQDLSLDEKAEFLLVAQGVTTATILGVLYTVASTFQPLPEDIYRYDWREPFSLQRGWLLWAGVGLAGAVSAVALTGAATSFFSGETPEREKDALVSLLPLIGSSGISTACLLGITGVFAPILEETVFRGFFMVSMTKWVPTPVAVVISAAVFALAHLTPGQLLSCLYWALLWDCHMLKLATF